MPVPHDSGYMVSDLGRVKSLQRLIRCGGGYRKSNEVILKSWVVKNTGYLQVVLTGRKKYAVHRLVLEAFVGPPPDGHECAHGDGDRKNARLSNLRWATKLENQADVLMHGNRKRGESVYNSVLTEDQVRSIRKDPRSRAEIGRQYGVTPEAISHIVLRKTWKWLD